MANSVQLSMEQGRSTGKLYTVPADGVRIGRISKNDIVIDDPLASRFHCRLFFKEDGRLWISDLGSSNQTLLNGKTVQESHLKSGDLITVGDTVLRVIFDAGPALPSQPPPPSSVDLGLAPPPEPRSAFRLSRNSLLTLAALLLVLLGGALLLNVKPSRPAASPALLPPVKSLEIEYEKVQASTGGIFRYTLRITPDRKIAVEIDSTDKIHVREEGTVRDELLQGLASFIEEAGFFSLSEDYSGMTPDVLESGDIAITIDRRTHRVRVINRAEPPPAFKKTQDKLEEFGKVELGIWAIQYAPEKLLSMAKDSYLLARKMQEEREVACGNLALAIKSYKDAEFCLQNVEPKPDYYAEVLTGVSVCQEELSKRYENQNFQATRAMNLKAWEDAARELRVLLEMIPEASDPRNQEARRKLLEVENRMKRSKQ